jgi:hypothetical protein
MWRSSWAREDDAESAVRAGLELMGSGPHPLSVIAAPWSGRFPRGCVMRRVHIVEKLNETYSYTAVDQQTGEVPLRLSDRKAGVVACDCKPIYALHAFQHFFASGADFRRS